MVSIAAFQAVDPGSIPGHRSSLFSVAVSDFLNRQMAPLSADKSMNVDQNVALFAPVIRGQTTAAISTFCGFTNFLRKQPKKEKKHLCILVLFR